MHVCLVEICDRYIYTWIYMRFNLFTSIHVTRCLGQQVAVLRHYLQHVQLLGTVHINCLN